MTATAGPLGRRRFLVWMGIVLLVLYLVIAGGGGTGGTHVAPFRVFTLLLLVLVIGAWTVVAWRAPNRRPATTMWPAIIAIILAFLVATLFSWNVRISIEFLGYAVLLVTLYLFLVQVLRDPALRPRMLSLVALLCGFIALLYVWIVVGIWIDWWDAVGRLTTPPLRPGFEGLSYGNPSAVAAILVLFLAPSIAWLAPKRRAGIIAIAVLLGLVAVTVVLTGSRGSWLGLGLAVGVTGVLALARPEMRRAIRDGVRRMPRFPAAAVAVMAAVVAVAFGPAILRRVLEGGGDNLRVTLNLTALRMFEQDPLTGSGPGTWVVRRAAFTEPQEVDYYIPHAHNIFTQALGEFGLVGILAGLVVAAFVGRLLLRALRDDDADRRRMAWAAVFGLTYIAGHDLVDFHMNLPAMLFAAVIPVAFLDATALNSEAPSAARSRSIGSVAEGRLGLAVIALACALSLGWLARIESAAVTALSAAFAAIEGDDATAARLASDALAGDPDLPAYWFQAGLATATVTENSEAALDLIRRSAEADDLPQAWLNVAAMELARGDRTAAETALTSAMRLGWQQPAVSFPAGALYVQLGDETRAVDSFAQALLLAPELGDDPFWATDPRIAAVHDAATDRAMTLAGPSGASIIALFADRTDDARSLAQQLSEDERRITTLAIDAWAGDAASQAALVEMAEAKPLDSRPVVWSALLAARDGDIAARDRFRRWAGITGGSLGTAVGQDVVVTDAPWDRRQVAGPNANFHGIYTYRRLYAWDLLVPGLPKLTLE